MLSKQETKGLARWKPLWILPLAVVFVLAFAESRTVVVEEAQEAVKATPADKAKHEMTEEEMMEALKEKWVKLEAMKKENTEALEMLKKKLEDTTDPAVKEKIMSKIKEQKLVHLEIGAKERMLQMKKIEMLLAKETDAGKKAEMENKLKQLKIESDEYVKKLESIHKAEEAAKQAEAEKK